MKTKLLNFCKNLIIVLGLVVIVDVLFFTTSSYAATGDTLGKIMRQNISIWYMFINRICILIFAVSYLLVVIKLLVNSTPENLKIFKESLLRFFIMFAIIYFLHIIMSLILNINDEILSVAKRIWANIAGSNMQNEEYDLYETALSKAYETAIIPGLIGTVMYLLLVYYTCKFVLVYLKRYINIIFLMLLAPIIFVVSSMKKILIGINDGKIRKWFKEFLFNVVIQSFHAIFYAIFIGITLNLANNEENLIGALISLIIFGFIFKIDSIIRKIFNFVGGSTKISSASSTFKDVLNTSSRFANRIEDKANSNRLARENGVKFNENLNNDSGEKASILQNASIRFSRQVAGLQSSIEDKKAIIKKADIKNVINGEKVKEKLTKDEIIEQYHIMEKGEGLEGVRQKVQHVAETPVRAVKKVKNGIEKIENGVENVKIGLRKVKNVGKYSKKQIKRAYNFSSGRVKAGISSALDQLVSDIDMLDNNIDSIKRMHKVLNGIEVTEKRKRIVRTKNDEAEEINVDNTMMLVVDTNVSPEEIIAELKREYGDDLDVSAFVFEKVGAQAFLSPALGSSRMGMAVLAEDNYETIAENKIERLITGNNLKSKVLRKISSGSKKKSIHNIERNTKIKGKVYKFNRFTPLAASRITNKMLNKTVEQNRYLIVIKNISDDVKLDNLKVSGKVDFGTVEINQTIRATRKNYIKSVKELKLKQQQAISKHKKLVRQTRQIEMANALASRVMSLKDVIKLGFKQIDNMTPGQVGLRQMIMEGKVQELSNDMVAVKYLAKIEEQLKLTGIIRETEPDTVVQFVISEDGQLVPQIVNLEGKIVKPALDEEGKLVVFNAIKDLLNENAPIKEGETEEEAEFRKMLSVKTDKPIPKELIFKCMEEINKVTTKAPVKIGDIILENVLGTGSNIVATNNVV